jgi:serine/threonine-protein kinase HipA
MKVDELRKVLYVFADWEGVNGPVFAGWLTADRVRGKEVFAFEYSQDWLKSPHAAVLDPGLGLFPGPQYPAPDHANFGVFLDSSPDRWGRVLLRRREAAMARAEQRPERNLFETDFLLGVYDGHRMGGLRFKVQPEGPFLDDNQQFAAPPWTSLRQLESISMKLEEEDAHAHPEYLAWLKMLVAPGASLGGARPKASVIDEDGQLWIAKFPSIGDGDDVGAWEFVAHRLALRSGIPMAACRLMRFSSRHHTFLAQRFDRNLSGGRKHFASAMTHLGFVDGQGGASYLDIVDFITTSGAEVKADLAQLYRRMVFNMAISNADDHLRNHGFLLTPGGWRLSPAYDLNPVETATGLHLNVSDSDNSCDWRLALEVASFFRLTDSDARALVAEVLQAIQHWRDEADAVGLSRSACERKARAFRTEWLSELGR